MITDTFFTILFANPQWRAEGGRGKRDAGTGHPRQGASKE